MVERDTLAQNWEKLPVNLSPEKLFSLISSP